MIKARQLKDWFGYCSEFVKFGGGFRDSPEWGSASVILPWLLYEWYGDATVLERSWPMMLRYVSYLRVNLIITSFLMDWETGSIWDQNDLVSLN